MKKIFALLLSVAMVASLFASVAFAEDVAYDGKILLDKTSTILSGDTYGTFRVTGRIVDNNGALINDDGDLSFGGGTPKAITDGRFSFLIETNGSIPVDMVVEATMDAGKTIKPSAFSLLYNVTLNKALDFVYSASAQEVITGIAKYADGTVKEGGSVQLYWLDGTDGAPGTHIVSASNTTKTGSFGFIVNNWSKAGKIGLLVDGVVHSKGEVKPLSMAVAAKPNTDIVHTVATTEVELKVSNAPVAPGAVKVSIFKGTETGTDVTDQFLYKHVVGETVTWPALADDTTFATDADGKVTIVVKDDFLAEKAGTYTIVTTSTSGLHKATTTITVVNPTHITLVDTAEKLKELEVGDNFLNFGPGNIRLVETNASGTIINENEFVYTVYVNGKLAKTYVAPLDEVTESVNAEKLESAIINIVTKDLDNVSVQVIVHRYEDSTVGSKVFDKTFTVPVTGWEVTYDVKTLTVGKAADVTFIIKDKDGNPVNNALITLSGDKTMSASKANIQNGTYVFEDLKYTAVGGVDITVTVLGATSVRASYTAGIQVIGEEVYTVTTNTDTLLQGKTQKILLTVSDADGTFIPEALTLYVDGVDKGLVAFTAKDTDNDGLADAIEVNRNFTSTEETILRASTSD